ncbi:hypothetical protein OH76DRAFT_864786 [Lentinus brumalis]|uniref:F-box domain-containing protein n=1 Tax=Lentinus brumalis TaxID=2498619 RepID=A0A371DRD3_9APHY|nr:hypothetical protein OH76DRAFT_864786 [Polyporus brumalis]
MHAPLSFSDLPVELGVEILEFLRGDSQALHSCCLTSKLWFQHAQPILYKSIRINPQNLTMFCNTIRKRPELVSHIRKLTLDGLSGTPLPPRELLPTRIEVLRVVGMELPNPWVLAALSTSRSSIQELVFRDCYMADPKRCLALPELLPSLKTFEIDQSWLRSKEEVNNAPPHIPGFSMPDVQSLSLTGDSAVPLDRSEPGTRPLPCGNLSVLKVSLDGDNMSVFRQYLQDAGPGLHKLDIDFGSYATFAMSVLGSTPPKLDKCVNLRSLDIEFRLLPKTPFAHLSLYTRTYLSYIPMLLEGLPGQCKQLQQVGFTARMSRLGSPADLDALDWEHVGQILSKGRFPSLRQVSACIAGGDGLRWKIERYFKEKLNVLDQRKLLELTFREHS